MIRLLFFLIGYNALAQQPPVPPVSEWITNVTYEVVTISVTNCHTNVVQRFPPHLTRFASATNLFRVACPNCGVERARQAKRIEVVGCKNLPEGDLHDRFIYFACCGEEFKAKNQKLVITPIAIELKP